MVKLAVGDCSGSGAGSLRVEGLEASSRLYVHATRLGGVCSSSPSIEAPGDRSFIITSTSTAEASFCVFLHSSLSQQDISRALFPPPELFSFCCHRLQPLQRPKWWASTSPTTTAMRRCMRRACLCQRRPAPALPSWAACLMAAS